MVGHLNCKRWGKKQLAVENKQVYVSHMGKILKKNHTPNSS